MEQEQPQQPWLHDKQLQDKKQQLQDKQQKKQPQHRKP
jgi:hypothetical protein